MEFIPDEHNTDIALEFDDWVLCRSSKHNKHYWFYTRTGYRFWALPADRTVMPPSSSSSPDTSMETSNNHDDELPSYDKIAIIVPYRDNQVEQRRSVHLARFIPYMTHFLKQSQVPFKIFIIEQNYDHRKFNRGKLLNVGFVLAESEGYTNFVFHDVDLLPSLDLLPYYARRPTDAPVHIAKIWNRYNRNDDYFGGIANFSKEQYEMVNGYPNNYWGWGGEDDELRKRLKECNLIPTAPTTSGTIIDLEEMNLQEKIYFLKGNEAIKCMNKNELLDEHDKTWKVNGLNGFHMRNEFQVLKVEYPGDFCAKITVQLELNNGHWSDKVCGELDRQYNPTPAQQQQSIQNQIQFHHNVNHHRQLQHGQFPGGRTNYNYQQQQAQRRNS